MPFRAFCVVDPKNIDDVRCLSVRLSHNHRPIFSDDASIAHHRRRLRSSYEDIGEKWVFLSFVCAVGTVVSCKQLSCTLLEKDIKDDVPIERYLSSESEIIGDDASINNHRNHQDYNSSYCLCLNMVPVHCTEYAKDPKGQPCFAGHSSN